MAKEKQCAKQIIRVLKHAEVLSGQGKTVEEICRALSISDSMYFKLRKANGGMAIDLMRRMRVQEKECKQLSGIAADLSLNN